MNGRKKHYIDIVLNEDKMKRLVDGYTVHSMVSGQAYSIRKETADPLTLKINALKQQIAELQARIAPKKMYRRVISERTREIWRANAAKARAMRAGKASNV